MKVLERGKYRIEVLKGAYKTLARDSLEFSSDIVRDYFYMHSMVRYSITWRTFPKYTKYHNELIRILMVFLRSIGIRIRKEGDDLDMNSKEFFDKVVQMREAQKKYFRTRSQQSLSESKILEREIDAEIKRVNDKMINGGVLF